MLNNFRLFGNSNIIRKFFSTKLKAENISGTILSPLGELKSSLPHRDTLYFDNQNLRWTAKELDEYSDAFAYYLLENGFSSGQKALLWTDISHTAETVTSITGSLKAGLNLVNSEFEDFEEIEKTLLNSNAEILILSPYTKESNQSTRLDRLLSSIPELNSFRYGENFKSSKFPNLKKVIQISHKTIFGTDKFKNCLSYIKPMMSNLKLKKYPSNNTAFSLFSNGKETNSFTHDELLTKLNNFKNIVNIPDFSSTVLNTAPLFYPANYTLGLLGAISSRAYSVVPGIYSFDHIIKLSESTLPNTFICEQELLNIQISDSNKISQIQKATQTVKNLIILSDDKAKRFDNQNTKKFFPNAEVKVFGDKSLELIN